MQDKPEDCKTCPDETCTAKTPKPGEMEEQYLERQAIRKRMCRIEHKVIVMSGKGGVGKTTVAVNLAYALSDAGKSVGLMDIDIHGPNVPKMLGVEKGKLIIKGDSILPHSLTSNLKLMSIAFLLRKDTDAVIWRGPMKMNLIKQFLRDVDWGNLDYLIIDAPPGTGDEPLSVVQLIEDLDGALIVTTPQDISLLDVRKSITFCSHLNLSVLGIVENMSGFVCPHCSKNIDIFKSGGGEKLASELNIKFLGKIPIDTSIVQQSDKGESIIENNPWGEVSKSFKDIAEKVEGIFKK